MFLPLIPAQCKEYRSECRSCGSIARVSDEFWLGAFDNSRFALPGLPEDLEHIRDQIIAVPTVRCEVCGAELVIAPPLHLAKHTVELFGDEAYRQYQGSWAYTYALVGTFVNRSNDLTERLLAMKSSLAPGVRPEEWHFHMKDLHSGDNRKKHRIFASWSRSNCERAIADLFGLLRGQFVIKYAITAHGTSLEDAKRRAFQALLIYVFDTLSKEAIAGQLCFDTERSSLGSIQKWARQLYAETRSNPMYLFLTRGLQFPEPRLIAPGSHACSELADFLAFIVARHHLDASRESENAAYPLEGAGSVVWARFDPAGSLQAKAAVGYPFDLRDG